MDDQTSWFGFDDLFFLTLLVLFASTLIGALLRRFRRDRCLQLFDDFHVTFIHADGKPRWGDLAATSQGVEIRYDAPFVNRRGLVKSSHLVMKDELADCLALCRTVHALTGEEQTARAQQIEKTFKPALLARSLRRLRNFADMISDAVGKSLSVIVGSLGGRLGAAMASRKSDVNELGKTLAGVVTNAYEPLLERYIGKPVIVECQSAPGAPLETAEFSGYLVEYTENFVAVFNSVQTPVEQLEVDVTTSEHEGFNITATAQRVTFTCTGPDALTVRDVQVNGDIVNLDVTLLPGCSLGLPTHGDSLPHARLERTHQFDLVCPRANARIRFGSEVRYQDPARRGMAPEEDEPDELPAQ